jgi:Coenzyme PQQ synthesis protein D (PqqD)
MTAMADRYALVELGPDSLLLDLVSGNLFQLNESATMVWASSLSGASPSTVAGTLALRYDISLSRAHEDVEHALTLDPDTATIDEPDGTYAYQRCATGYLFSRSGVPLLEVDEQGRFVRPAGTHAMEQDPIGALQAVTPKLLALRGHLVLHASAVLIDQSVIALAGRSGAGKTTTARALSSSGVQLISEDKLLFRSDGDRVEAFVGGEQRIMEWVAAAVPQLSAGNPVACEALDDAAAGESRPLRAICFLDAARRMGASIAAVMLGRAESTRAFFRNTFHGSDRPADWRHHLEAAANATRRLSAQALTVPTGIQALQAAARRASLREMLLQTEMTAS